MSFLPEDYKGVPDTSNYMRFEDGRNRFRILGSAIVGMEYWKTVDKKRTPFRIRMNESVDQSVLEVNPKTGKPDQPKHFWAFVVYNCVAEKIQILEITQKTVMNGIKALIDSEDWGDPKEYDIMVTKEGKELETNYSVMPSPKKMVLPDVTNQYSKIDRKSVV
jgi:hypothetical protein